VLLGSGLVTRISLINFLTIKLAIRYPATGGTKGELPGVNFVKFMLPFSVSIVIEPSFFPEQKVFPSQIQQVGLQLFLCI